MWKVEITDQRRTNSLTSSSCLSTFRTSCVLSSEKEEAEKHIDQLMGELRFMTRALLLAHQQEKNKPAFEDVFTRSCHRKIRICLVLTRRGRCQFHRTLLEPYSHGVKSGCSIFVSRGHKWELQNDRKCDGQIQTKALFFPYMFL